MHLLILTLLSFLSCRILQVQFLICLLHVFQSMYFDCDFPKWMLYGSVLYGVTILCLFFNFYYESYIRHESYRSKVTIGPQFVARLHYYWMFGTLRMISVSSAQTETCTFLLHSVCNFAASIFLPSTDTHLFAHCFPSSFKCYVTLFSLEFDPNHPLVTLTTLNHTPL